MRKAILLGLTAGLLLSAAPFTGAAAAAKEEPVVNIYTARHYESDKALYAQFTKDTGIAVNVVSGKAPELIERIKREGANTEADLFITVDGGVLNTAKKADILQKTSSGVIAKVVPAHLRDKESFWVGLTTRARVIVYSKERVKPADLSTYEALADPPLEGQGSGALVFGAVRPVASGVPHRH